jgi:hypothetical protein
LRAGAPQSTLRARGLVLACSALAAFALGGGAVTASGGRSAATLTPDGIGAVRFGLTKARAVEELDALFGAPAARGINTGCGRRYTEAVWGDLAAEFRAGTFSGYRYSAGGYPLTTPGSPHESSPPKTRSPRLATATGISLGSTLAELRAAYRGLRPIGVDNWRAPNGLVFVDDAEHDPEPPSSRLVELKIGTCGGF